MAATEAGAVLEFALERYGEEDDEKIGRGVENYGERTEYDELKEHVAVVGRNELRYEG